MAKKPKTLKDFDDKTLEIIEKRVAPKEPESKSIDATVFKMYKCPNDPCGGTLEKVRPVIKMGTLELFECPVCGSRKYLRLHE